VGRVLEHVAQASGIRFTFEREDRQSHVNSYTFYLSYQGPLPTPNSVKVDITISELVLFPVEHRPALRAYPEFDDLPEDRMIAVYGLQEIATEKVVALSDPARNEPRDLYELWFLTGFLTVEAGVDLSQLVPGDCGKTPLPTERNRRPRRAHSQERGATEVAVDRAVRSPDRDASRVRRSLSRGAPRTSSGRSSRLTVEGCGHELVTKNGDDALGGEVPEISIGDGRRKAGS
jgi:hypothetical protein